MPWTAMAIEDLRAAPPHGMSPERIAEFLMRDLADVECMIGELRGKAQ